MKQKNYLKLFVDYARKNKMGYTVYSDGMVAAVHIIDDSFPFEERNLNYGCAIGKLGSKAAYEWLISQERKEK